MDVTANGSPRELGPSVVGGAGASSRFERQDATHAEAGFVPRNHAGSQASEHCQKTPASNARTDKPAASHINPRRTDLSHALDGRTSLNSRAASAATPRPPLTST